MTAFLPMTARLALWLLLSGLTYQSAHGKLVFTEIMISSQKETGSSTQWIELFNTASTIVSLNQWALVCQVGTFTFFLEINTGISIGPSGVLVIGSNDNILTNGGINVDIVLELPKFPPDGGGINTLTLLPPFSKTAEDLIQWSANNPSLPGRNFTFTPGASLAKINTDVSSLIVSNWKPSTSFINCDSGGDKGTPGKANDFKCATKARNCGLLQLNLFCLNGCGIFGRVFRLCSS